MGTQRVCKQRSCQQGAFRAWPEVATRQGLRFHALGFPVTQAVLQVV